MEKKFIINRVDLGQRVTGYKVFNPAVNGGEVIGMTAKQLGEAVKAGEVLDGNGIGTLTSTDPSAVANLMYTVYKREGDNFSK